ncbi:MAG: Triosephosphate isomerase [Parcubacteria group bacterium GW2011_GWD2_43_10]|uniref:Triosephosphate isomerase n=4 Tax=Candidatus Vebleniibacteriota TaxID=1817921 RepID=A0A1G2Q6P1_9BACT|nr:MAG: Triosephosphate isomerase [Parcubacteria group bacterium GW2011_GWD1_42_9]KKS83158.1 MAG: Triosephosphate isomerase [Parcubacteria group bacterium GW2011_GWD2_43_10]KKS94025.1 MAG: Triosephosphate isomerase [Parcubacteria group bacterium GW2011_GWE2_43_12]KKT13884.1 MAG: Triosephosphate isomerase [Parcubacteria group bacterium GW2011_GWA1_43_27]KKT21851.1 MAG: Triosephosphate isomerase [Parcubacteria group bacterium GW2011_GWE1_43_8]KKT26074.1 MAG: Triosephosphate isomerase [Parcubacte
MPLTQQKPLVVANWKMNLSLAESVALAKNLSSAFTKFKLKEHLELALCPTYPALPQVAEVLKKKDISLGAQDVFWKPLGPYTGEVSPRVLAELGVSYIVIGHSERRQFLKETDAIIQQKVLATLAEGLTPVLCVGETFAERQAGQKDLVIARQVTAALNGVTLAPGLKLVIAYEPVWVIGSGQAVEPKEANETALVIHQALLDFFSPSVVDKQVKIIYGGSVDPTNINNFVGQGLLAGVLVGGASLEAKRFINLMNKL